MWHFLKREARRMRLKTCIEQEISARCRIFQHIAFFLLHFCIDIVHLSWFLVSISILFYLIEEMCWSRKYRTSSVQEYIDSWDLHTNCLQLLYILIWIAASTFPFSIKNLHKNWSKCNLSTVLLYFPCTRWVKRIRYLKIKLLKPTGYVMHQQFNIQELYVLPTLYLCVLYLSENKQRLVPLTA